MTDLWGLACSAKPDTTVNVPSSGLTTSLGTVLRAAESTAGQIAGALGPGRPARLGLLADNGEPWVRGALAAWRLGATLVPLPLPVAFAGPSSYATHVGGIARDAGLDAVLIDSSTPAPAVLRGAGPPLIDITGPAGSDAPPPQAVHDAAIIQYTSGSTSRPKGVLLTHGNVATGIEMLWRATGCAAGDSLGLWLPLYHDMGLFSMLTGLVYGMPVSLWKPREFIRRPMRWLSEFAAARLTVTTAPNFFYDTLAAAVPDGVPADLDLSAWRLAINGAEPVKASTLAAFTRAFADHGLRPKVISPAYGLAEATLLVSVVPPGRPPRIIHVDRSQVGPSERLRLAEADDPGSRPIVSCGLPVPPLRLRIGDEDGQRYPEGVVGEAQIAGPSVTAGYLGIDRSAQPFTADGWLRTGDLAFLRDGELYIVGRTKDMIIVRGVNYYPEDVEEMVRTVPEAAGRCAAFAWADESGERIVVLWETVLDGSACEVVGGLIRRRLYEGLGLGATDVVAVAPRTIQLTSSGKVKRAQTRETWRPVPRTDSSRH